MTRYAALYQYLGETIPEASRGVMSDFQLSKTIQDIYDARWEDIERESSV